MPASSPTPRPPDPARVPGPAARACATAGLLAALCWVAGCADLSPAQRSGVQAGSVASIGTGFICNLLGGRTQQCVVWAATIGAAAALAGFKYAERLDAQRQALAGRENELDAQIAYAREVNRTTQELNGKRQALIDRADGELRQARAREAQLAELRQTLDDQLALARSDTARGERALAEIGQLRTRPQARDSAELDAQIAQLERALAQARSQTAALASMRQRL